MRKMNYNVIYSNQVLRNKTSTGRNFGHASTPNSSSVAKKNKSVKDKTQRANQDKENKQTIKMITENCLQLTCKTCKMQASLDEFLKHLDILKVQRGDFKCTKKPIRQPIKSKPETNEVPRRQPNRHSARVSQMDCATTTQIINTDQSTNVNHVKQGSCTLSMDSVSQSTMMISGLGMKK